ncbi:MAG: hypothetical protein NTX33_14410 [Propionibacteriales bacterium]|nr:hypothetical protein [Propionibacteriales bacterium]
MIRKLILVLVVGLALSAVGAYGLDRTPDRSTPVSVGDLAGVDRADLASVMKSLEERVREQPKDGRSWATLGHVYVEQSRVTGDLDYYARADRALATALSLNRDDDLALAGKAAVAAARHDFHGALRYADEALALNSYQPTALAIRVDALTELGRYADQESALRTADERAPGPPVLLRMSYASELRGDLAGAERLLALALEGTTAGTDRAFILTILADLDRKAGRLEASREHLAEAIEADVDFGPAYASRARLAVAGGDLDEALRRWREAHERSGSPESAIELAELLLLAGRTAEAEPLLRAAKEGRVTEVEAGVDMDLEVAQFEADHGSSAVALAAARREWGLRETVHTADALAWALHADGRSNEALPYAVAATRLGTPDARFWLHRAIIEAELGRDRPARLHLAKGLSIDPGVSPTLADEARRVLRQET